MKLSEKILLTFAIGIGISSIVGLLLVKGVAQTDAHFECQTGDEEGANLYQKNSEWVRVGEEYGNLDLQDGFSFEGYNLNPKWSYSLIVYDTVTGDDDQTEWPGEGPILGSGTPDECGYLKLTGKLPFCLDEAKIWLVPTKDVKEDGTMAGWNPTQYLFEHERFTTCEPEPTPTPTQEPEPPPTPTQEPSPTPTPEYTEPDLWNCSMDHSCKVEMTAPVCTDLKVLELPANFHVIRDGSIATLKWNPTGGNEVNVFYKENDQQDWTHALGDQPNNGNITISELNPVLGYTFGLMEKNGCGNGDMVTAVVIDPPARGKIFGFSFWRWN